MLKYNNELLILFIPKVTSNRKIINCICSENNYSLGENVDFFLCDDALYFGVFCQNQYQKVTVYAPYKGPGKKWDITLTKILKILILKIILDLLIIC